MTVYNFCWYVFGVKQSWQRLYAMFIGVLLVLHKVDNDRELCVCASVCVCVCVCLTKFVTTEYNVYWQDTGVNRSLQRL